MTTISRWAGGVLLAASLLPWAAAASASTGTSGEIRLQDSQRNTTATSAGCNGANFDQAKLAAGFDGFHFVLPGSTYTFDELSARFDTGTITTTTFVKNGTQAFVYAPHGSVLLDAFADVTPNPTGDVRFVLSGTCSGSGSPSTSSTPCPTATVTKTVTETAPGPTQTVTHTVTTTAPGATETVTAPATTVTAPPETVTATHTATATATVTETETATVTATHTVTAPGETVTVPGPTETVTTTAPGATVTTTAPGATITTTAPGSTSTQTVTQTVTASTGVLPTKVGQSTTAGTAVLGEKLPQTGPGLPVGKALALSLLLMIAGVGLLVLPGHVGLEMNRKH